jgi:hypothetical protein
MNSGKGRSQNPKRQSLETDALQDSILIPALDLESLIELCRANSSSPEHKLRYIEQELCWFRDLRREKERKEFVGSPVNNASDRASDAFRIYGTEKLSSKSSFRIGKHRRNVKGNISSTQ